MVFSAHTETLSNGFVVDVAASVGLLTRNIKVMGEDYPDLYTESFGARILVSLVTYKGDVFSGRLNVNLNTSLA